MYEPLKRKITNEDEFEGFENLVNQHMILSEKEYELKKFSKSYEEYTMQYFLKRIPEVFSELKNKVWFIDRYIKRENVIQKKSIESPYFFIMENIDFKLEFEHIKSILLDDKNVIDIFLEQKGPEFRYARNLYVNLKHERDISHQMKSINHYSKSYFIKFEEIEIDENYQIPVKSLLCIFNDLCEKDGLDSGEIIDSYCKINNKFIDQRELLVKLLREKFRYCTHCGKQYDNDVVMYRRCSKHSFTSIMPRNIEIAELKKNISKLTFPDKTKILYSKISEGIFMCNICSKRFESEEFVRKHSKGKHSKFEKAIQENEIFNMFLSRIDYFIFDVICGLNSFEVFNNFTQDNQLPVYDMPHWFTGEIKLKPKDI